MMLPSGDYPSLTGACVQFWYKIIDRNDGFVRLP